MSDPLTVAGGFAAGTVGVTLATLFPEATPGVMRFSLGGAALYVLTSEPHQIWKQAVFASMSFLGGSFAFCPNPKTGAFPDWMGVMNDMGFDDASRKRGGLPADNVPSDVFQ